jgi:hypothetical protein
VQKGDPRAFHRHIGSRAHRDPDVCGCEGGRVVDAVAGHGHDSSLVAQPGHDLALAIGEHLGLHAVDAEPTGDRLGGHLVVTGQHDHVDTGRAQPSEGLGRALLNLIGDRDDSNRTLIHRDEDRRRTLGLKRVGLAGHVGGVDPTAVQEARAADHDLVSVNGARGSLAGGGVEIVHGWQGLGAVLAGPCVRCFDDGPSQWMLGRLLDRCCYPQGPAAHPTSRSGLPASPMACLP